MSKQVLTMDLTTGKKQLVTVIDDEINAAGKEDMAYSAKAVDNKVEAISGTINSAVENLISNATYQNGVYEIFSSETIAETNSPIDGKRYAINNLIKIYHAAVIESGTVGQPGYIAPKEKYWELVATVADGARLVNFKDLQEYKYNSTLGTNGYNGTGWKNVLEDPSLVHTTGDEIINGKKEFVNDTKFDGNVEITKNLTVNGDVVFNGAVTKIETTNTLIKDNIILLNDGDAGVPTTGGITSGSAGIEINRGETAPKAQILYTESVGTFQAGLEGDLKNVALINDSVITSTKETYSIDKLQTLFTETKSAITDSTLFTFTAAMDITAGQIVYVTSDGKVAMATNTNQICMDKIAGIAMQTVLTGATVQVAKFGRINNLSGLTIGNVYFLGINGSLVDTCPSTTGSFICRIGVATDVNTILLQLGESVLIA